MQTLDNINHEIEELESKKIDLQYKEVIGMILLTPAKNDANFQCAFFLAWAIKECMKNKDSEHLDKAYIWEKVSKAMRSIDMPIWTTEQLG